MTLSSQKVVLGDSVRRVVRRGDIIWPRRHHPPYLPLDATSALRGELVDDSTTVDQPPTGAPSPNQS